MDEARVSEVHRCGEDIEAHTAKILVGTRITELGFGCATTYEALIELAYAVKVVNNFPDYDPTGVILKKMAEAAARTKVGQA